MGNNLTCKEHNREEAKDHDEYAVGTYLKANNELVGHVPIDLSFLIYIFLRAHNNNEIAVKIIGSRRLENGLVVHGAFIARTPSRAIASKFEREILRLKELCIHMEIAVERLMRILAF